MQVELDDRTETIASKLAPTVAVHPGRTVGAGLPAMQHTQPLIQIKVIQIPSP